MMMIIMIMIIIIIIMIIMIMMILKGIDVCYKWSPISRDVFSNAPIFDLLSYIKAHSGISRVWGRLSVRSKSGCLIRTIEKFSRSVFKLVALKITKFESRNVKLSSEVM